MKYPFLLILDDAFVLAHQQRKLSLDAPFEFQSSLLLLQGLQDYFKDDQIYITTPRRVLSGETGFSLSERTMVPVEEPVSSDIGVIFSVDSNNPEFDLAYVQRQYSAYAQLEVARFMNPLRSKALLDKRSLYDNDRVKDKLPKRLSNDTWGEIYAHVETYGQIVLKHRIGAEGDDCYLVTADNVGQLEQDIAEALDEFVAQELVNVGTEKRLMVFGKEIVAGRIYTNRHHPWEEDTIEKPGRNLEAYQPTPEEEALAREIVREFGLDFCAIDFIGTSEREYLLEINGICPGLLSPTIDGKGHIYNLGKEFAHYLFTQWQPQQL